MKKTRFGAFVPGSSDLHAVVQARKIDTLIITGSATDVCCGSTARDAVMMSYKVIFVSDGTASHTDQEHNSTMGIMLAMFADVMSTDEVVTCLSKIGRPPSGGVIRPSTISATPLIGQRCSGEFYNADPFVAFCAYEGRKLGGLAGRRL